MSDIIPFIPDERSFIDPRRFNDNGLIVNGDQAISMAQNMGIELPESELRRLANNLDIELSGASVGGDNGLVPTLTGATNQTPVQFLQTILTGVVHYLTQARKADMIMGISNQGNWEDKEIVQPVMELTGKAKIYGDYQSINYANFNVNFVTRGVVRFELGSQIGYMADLIAKRMNINSQQALRLATLSVLEIERNKVAFYGFNDGTKSLIYGLLNDQSQLPYETLPIGAGGDTTFSSKNFQEITKDFIFVFGVLQVQSGDNIDPATHAMTMSIASEVHQHLNSVTDFGVSVIKWLKETYKNLRIVPVPEFNGADAGENVLKIKADTKTVAQDTSTDDKRAITQIVPSKAKLIGSERHAKGTAEVWSNSTAGALVKRPTFQVSVTGI